MEKDLVAVLGGGNGGHAVAAELSLAGYKVNFFELPQLRPASKRSCGRRKSEPRGFPEKTSPG